MKKIILASSSPRRSELLKQLGLSFTVYKIDVEEEIEEKNPENLAERLAFSKAEAVAKLIGCGVVIGADTIVSVDGCILGKPQDRNEAAKMLNLLSGRTHMVLTGLAVIVQPGFYVQTHVERTFVRMRDLKQDEIEWYLNCDEPYDKAGGYGIQGKAAVFIDRLEGCYYNVVGLPLAALWRLLDKAGVCVCKGADDIGFKAPDH